MVGLLLVLIIRSAARPPHATGPARPAGTGGDRYIAADRGGGLDLGGHFRREVELHGGIGGFEHHALGRAAGIEVVTADGARERLALLALASLRSLVLALALALSAGAIVLAIAALLAGGAQCDLPARALAGGAGLALRSLALPEGALLITLAAGAVLGSATRPASAAWPRGQNECQAAGQWREFLPIAGTGMNA